MKRNISLVLVLLSIILLSGCSNNQINSTTNTTTKTTFTTTTVKKTDESELNKFLLLDMSDIRWGMSEKEVVDKKKTDKNYREFTDKSNKIVEYYYNNYPSNLENPYNIDETKYWFYQSSEKLVAIMVEFEERGGSYKNYEKIINVLKDTYGAPTKENMKYNDTTYKDNPETAFNYGYLTIETKWTNQDGFDIVVNWEKDYGYITYMQKGYKGII